MKPSVLIVEDDVEFIDELRRIFAKLPRPSMLAVASSHSAAVAALDRDFYDLILLDLKIPTVDGALDADSRHGHAVFAHARSMTPGTPIFVLTGSPAEDFIRPMLRQTNQVDIWGEGVPLETIQFLRKLNVDEFPKQIGPMISAIDGLNDIEIIGTTATFGPEEKRLVSIFAKKFRGVSVRVSPLGGGLSAAKVARLYVTDSQGARVCDVAAKLGSPETIRSEGDRYNRMVVRLDPGATPRNLGELYFGGGKQSGIFYGLAEGFSFSAFDAACSGEVPPGQAVKALEAATANWRRDIAQTRRPIHQVRRRMLTDEWHRRILEEFSIPWAVDFEAREIQTLWACIHGDLHGANALLSKDGRAVLIDYGDVGDGTVSLDPNTLELSLLFHPDGPDMGDWPSLDQAKHWGSPDAYLQGCPAEEFVRECRRWANDVAAGPREIAASAYSYLIRQLKYDETNKELALALLDGVKTFFDAR